MSQQPSPHLSTPLPGCSHLQSPEVGDAAAGLVPFGALLCLVLQPCLLKPLRPLPNPHEVSLPRSKTQGGGPRYITPALPCHSIGQCMREGRGVDLVAVGAGAGWGQFLSWARGQAGDRLPGVGKSAPHPVLQSAGDIIPHLSHWGADGVDAPRDLRFRGSIFHPTLVFGEQGVCPCGVMY